MKVHIFQGQMLTLVEYLLLLYRALLPTPVWYRFFLNKEYGSLFSSLMTGLYLTFKLTSVVEKVLFLLIYIFQTPCLFQCFFPHQKGSTFWQEFTFPHCCYLLLQPFSPLYLCGHDQVQSFFSALKALSRKEVHYGAYATSEQVTWTSFFSQTHAWS